MEHASKGSSTVFFESTIMFISGRENLHVEMENIFSRKSLRSSTSGGRMFVDTPNFGTWTKTFFLFFVLCTEIQWKIFSDELSMVPHNCWSLDEYAYVKRYGCAFVEIFEHLHDFVQLFHVARHENDVFYRHFLHSDWSGPNRSFRHTTLLIITIVIVLLFAVIISYNFRPVSGGGNSGYQ